MTAVTTTVTSDPAEIKANTTTKSWRDVVEIHPAAEMFPLMSPAEIKALGNDSDHLYELPLPGRSEIYPDPYEYVLSANIHRRHLTAEQKREIIAGLLKADPTKSDRQIAETVKASPSTVGTVRHEMESTVQPGQLPPKRVGKDGKSRKQPARTTRGKRTTSGLPEALAVVVEPDPAEHPESMICEPLDPKQGVSNPITRAWIKATKSQQIAFALDFKEVIAGLSADEQRRHPHAEQRRLHRPANDLDMKFETKIETEENATNGAAAGDGDGLDIPAWLQRPTP
jgi:hypothetical protein